MSKEESLLDMLKRHEGTKTNKEGRHIPYTCSAGKLTIGYGRNLTDKGISKNEAISMLVHDMEDAMKDVAKIFPDYRSYSTDRRLALLDMLFNLGRTRFLGFRKMIAAILDEDWGRAAEEAADSKWYKQVGHRGVENVNKLLNG